MVSYNELIRGVDNVVIGDDDDLMIGKNLKDGDNENVVDVVKVEDDSLETKAREREREREGERERERVKT